ncbi:MAG TPA: peroxidase-related enzyme [Xanthobacteraceae bacterium]|nr:peroxidase-related enzyme [Xanthobacteraceae bacterium]
MFLKTIDESEATGRVAEIYAGEQKDLGLVMEASKCWTARPDMLPVISDMFAGLKKGFTLDMRDWRLITLIAAIDVPSTYCVTVYGHNLIKELGSKELLLAIVRDFRTAGLSERDVAMLDYAQKVAREAHRITQGDIDALRGHGFSDPQIADIAMCAALRCFVARYFEAVGAGPEAKFVDEDPAARAALTVGRPLAA